MKINEITVGRKFNIGNFESLEVRVSVSPDPAEEKIDWQEAVDNITEQLNKRIKEMAVKLK
jgi:hypothetical protein